MVSLHIPTSLFIWSMVLVLATATCLLATRYEAGCATPAGPPAASTRFACLSTATFVAGAVLVSDLVKSDGLGNLQVSMLGAAVGVAFVGILAPVLTRHGRVASFMSWAAASATLAPATGPWTRPVGSGDRGPFRETLAAVALLTVLTAVFASLVSSGPLGHDEAVYALKARSWSNGSPASGFAIYRPIGMPVVAWGIMQVSEGETALRFFGVVSSVAAVATCWRLGRAMFSPAVGLLAAALFGGAWSFVRRTPEFLNDTAVTALVLAVVLVLWRSFEDADSARWHMVLAAPLAAVAFYLRYGVVSALLVIALVSALVWHRKIRGSIKQIGVTALGFLALVTPHMLYSISRTGSVTGILDRAERVAGRDYLGEGLRTYATWFPERLAGPIGGVVLLLSLAALLPPLYRVVRGRTLHRTGRAVVLAGLVGTLQIVISGVLVHAEERYVFVSVALLLTVGANVVVEAATRLVDRTRTILGGIGVALLSVSLVVGVALASDVINRTARAGGIVVDAAAAVVAATGDETCVVSTAYVPQIAWYTRCESVEVDGSEAGKATLMLLFDNGRRQAMGDELEFLLDSVDAELIDVVEDPVGTIGDARLYRVDATGTS